MSLAPVEKVQYLGRKLEPPKKPRKPIRRLGRLGLQRKKGKDHARANYFTAYGYPMGDTFASRCQCCRRELLMKESDMHHKKKCSAGGDERPANMLAVHGKCHKFIHAEPYREKLVLEDPASCANGKTIDWNQGHWSELVYFLERN